MDHPLPDAPGLPAETALPDVPKTWATSGFNPKSTSDGTLQGTIPAGVLIIAATTPDANKALGAVCQPITSARPFVFEVGGCGHYAYALADGVDLPEGITLPDGIEALAAGAAVLLSDTMPQNDLPPIGAEEFAVLAAPKLDPVIINNPLSQYSLRGQAEEFALLAVQAKPLLGNLCLTGQATVWYAPPNAGKTLIMLKLLIDAVANRRITPDNVYYLNCDDSSEGFAGKIRLMDDMGCHTLAPGHRGFQPVLLPELLHAMADGKKARGALIIIDTIKKAASLMDKGKASAFAAACRSAVMAGATIIGFAHTNKQPSASGKLQYGGTSDLRDDFDAAYIMGPVEVDGFDGEKVVQFDCIKSRGGNVRSSAYVYADTDGLSYTPCLGPTAR
jgi:hypothetical protein